tara:strand:- start:565 stop:1284 length:720 start_codon:yes stop_codon:yes gene_type:complete
MKKDKKIKIYLGLIYFIILSIFFWVFFSKFSINEITSYDFIKNNRDYLILIKESNYFLVSILFILTTIIWVLLLGFGLPIILPAGFIFGKWTGTLLATTSLTIGATFLYLFANYFMKDLVEEKFSRNFSNLNNKFKKNEFVFFLVYRFIGGIPFQIQNILPVLFNIKLKNYFFGTLLGITPQIFVWASLGSGIEKIIDQNIQAPSYKDLVLSPEIYFPIIGFIILLILGLLIKKIFFKD